MIRTNDSSKERKLLSFATSYQVLLSHRMSVISLIKNNSSHTHPMTTTFRTILINIYSQTDVSYTFRQPR